MNPYIAAYILTSVFLTSCIEHSSNVSDWWYNQQWDNTPQEKPDDKKSN